MKINIGGLLIWTLLLVTASLFIVAKLVGGEGIVFSWLIISQLFSLIGVTLLAISFVLSSRWEFVERLFGGIGNVYNKHHMVGGLAFVFLIHHPIFLIFDVLPDTSFAWKYVLPSGYWPYNFGIFSLYAMMLMLIFTLVIKLPYATWKITHEFMGVSLLLACFHIMTTTSDVSRFLPLRIWVVILLITALYAAIYRRFIYTTLTK